MRTQTCWQQVEVCAFFREVHVLWVAAGQYPLSVEDVKDELFDIVRPADPLRITPGDLLVIPHPTLPQLPALPDLKGSFTTAICSADRLCAYPCLQVVGCVGLLCEWQAKTWVLKLAVVKYS